MKCSVASCALTRRYAPPGVTFHLAPSKPEIREFWFEFCQLPLNLRQKLYICSSHFAAGCFERNVQLQKELVGGKFRTMLKRDAIPTVLKPDQLFRGTDKGCDIAFEERLPSDKVYPVHLFQNKMNLLVEAIDVLEDLQHQEPIGTTCTEEAPEGVLKDCCEAVFPSRFVKRYDNEAEMLNNRTDFTVRSDSPPFYGFDDNDLRVNEISPYQKPSLTLKDVPGELFLETSCKGTQSVSATQMEDSDKTLPIAFDDDCARFDETDREMEQQLTEFTSGDEACDEDILDSVSSMSETCSIPETDHTYALSFHTQTPKEWYEIAHFEENSIENELVKEQATSTLLRKQLTELKAKSSLDHKQFAARINAKDKELKIKERAVQDLRRACVSLQEMKEDETLKRVKTELSKILTSNQIDLLMGLKKRVNWTAEEIALSFTIRYHGISVWNLLKKELNFPLPAIQTLRAWSSRIQMHIGILKDVVGLMKIASGSMSARERVIILTFDEVSCEETVEYDSRNDRIVGPHKNLQVIMARGLFSNWKQPVYCAFDTKMTLTILNDVITEMFVAGYTVVGCVSDCGGGNQGLWNECGIDIVKDHTKTFIEHPITSDNIYFFPDAPHLLKLIRNWLLDEGFLYKGKAVTKLYLEKLVKKASTLQTTDHSSELNSLFKLSVRHIMCNGSERQNVRLAAELMSHSTAVNLRRHFGDSEEAMLLAEIIDTVDAWFNVMNSYSLSENVTSKKCFGEALEQQLKILDNMALLVASIRTLKKQKLPATQYVQVFQKGIMMSINSTKLLFSDMQRRYQIRFIMTYKLNQDCLENLFGQMRQNGGPNNHPSPVDALNRLRLIILGKGLKHQLTHNQNSQNILIKEDFVICRVFKQARISLDNEQQNEDEDESDMDIPEIHSDERERTLEEEDGFEYAMGFVARSLRDDHPELGEITAKTEDTSQASYVKNLSFGGLTEPSQDWLNQAQKMETVFNAVHNTENENSGFKQKTNVKKTTTKILKKRFPHISDNVISKFSRTRINIRVTNMKKNIKERKYLRAKINKKPDDVKSAVTRKNAQKVKHFRN